MHTDQIQLSQHLAVPYDTMETCLVHTKLTGMKYIAKISLCARLQDLEAPEQTYRKLGAKLVVGMPFKDLATSDTLYMAQIPPSSDKNARRALKRLQVS